MIETHDIYITGMSQAGSTLCYNMVRLLVECAGYPVKAWHQERRCIYRKDRAKQREYVLIKQHDLSPASPISYDKRPEAHVINVKRDLRDATASAYRKFPDKDKFDILKAAARNIEWYNCWTHLADYEWVYEDYKKKPQTILSAIQRVFGFELGLCELNEIIKEAEGLQHETLKFKSIAERLDFEDMTRMDKTQITNKGIIGGYKDTLSTEEIELIEDAHGPWLRQHGYMK